MRNSLIILKKQLKDTFKNKTIFIQFVLFPLMTLVMEKAINIEGMPELFFTKLFSTMYVGMAPLTSVASIISEEKEKNTLRVLMMANIKPWEYLVGVGIYVWTICMLGALIMASGLKGDTAVIYITFMAIGFVISIIAGACIGIFSKNQMEATSLTVPAMMVLSFAPMLSMFNDNISKVAKFFYTQQLNICFSDLSFEKISRESYAITIINFALLVIIFAVTYKRKGLE